jgi:carboxymethylenebutenolidase
MGLNVDIDTGEKDVAAYLAVPSSGTGPGVLVLHAWWGLNDVFREVCDGLAAEGFVALAPDLHDGAIAEDIPTAERLLKAVPNADRTRYVEAAADALQAQPEVIGASIGIVGFSMGASWAVWLAPQRPNVAAVVAFYGASDGGFAGEMEAAFQGHYAEHDDFEPAEAVRRLETELREAGRDAQVHVYPGTGHWFFERDRPSDFNSDAAALAWERTAAFLHSHLDPKT